MTKPTIIQGPLPGEEVDKHLKKYGHLPGDPACCSMEAYKEGLNEARELLVQADSKLSLLEARAGITTWGKAGMCERQEIHDLIGKIRRAYEN